MENKETFQIKCDKCGGVRNVVGPLNENDKICPNCSEVINESGILKIVQESFLLE